MSNIKIGYANAIDFATLTATGVSSNLPIDNVKTTNRWQVFRANSTIQTITGTFDTVRQIGVVALWLPTGNAQNLTFDVELYNGGTTVVADFIDQTTSVFFDVVSVTGFMMVIRSTAPVDLSRIFMGNVFTPTYNFEFGFSMKYKDLSTSERLEDGSLHVLKKQKYRILSLNLADILESERAKLTEMIVYSGIQNDCYVSLFNGSTGSGRTDFEMIGFFDDGAELSLTSPSRWNNKLVVNEM